MKRQLAITFVLGSAILAAGCATKKYVTNTTEPIQAKLDRVGAQANSNAAASEENRKEIKAVDERAQNGISAAKERALTAENKAAEALNKANEAAQAAADARSRAENNTSQLGSLRNVVSSLTAEDYKRVAAATIPFSFGQDKLSPEAKDTLDKLAASKGNLKRFVIVVEGFTDKTGSTGYNDALSQRRANAVVSYLVTRHDVPLYRVHTAGLGSQKPADEGKTREARGKNRRVEVAIFSADQTLVSPAP